MKPSCLTPSVCRMPRRILPAKTRSWPGASAGSRGNPLWRACGRRSSADRRSGLSMDQRGASLCGWWGNGELVGGCELRLRPDGTASMSYWTFPQYRRRGLATRRSAQLAAEYAFARLEVAEIELHMEPDNTGSLGVARGAGFYRGGQEREVSPVRRDSANHAAVRVATATDAKQH